MTTEEAAVLLIFPCKRAEGNDFKLREDILNVRKVFFYKEGGKTLEQVSQRDDPNSGNIPGQVGWGSEQPNPIEDVFAHGRGVESQFLNKHVVIQKLCFYVFLGMP